MNNVYCTIEKLLNDRGCTRKELEEATGISRSLLTELKTNRTKEPSADSLKKIAAFFNVTTDDILNGDESQAENEEMGVRENNGKIERFAALPVNEWLRVLRLELGAKAPGDFVARLGLDGDIEVNVDRYMRLEQENYRNFLADIPVKHMLEETMEYYKKIGMNYDYDACVKKGEYLKLEEINRTSLALRIIERRQEKSLTQQQLADKLGVDIVSVISWESGERSPLDESFKNLNGALDLGDDIRKKYFVIADGFSEENQKKLEKFLEFLKIDEMNKRNIELSNEFTVKE